ncbi:dynamin family protein [Microbacterium terricola]|uniref:GTPase n=1 Tax=Microbacterium terricola TaxID=344163 RepID=A0ABM8E2C6_9MICO|nr:dynamin family protein [Microbacterium terricola]UYK40354.1 dynamin family protein [Microbacterium terricola]BDV31932.1 GTPase [Microbacterium terricola]
MSGALADVTELVDEARAMYAGDSAAEAALDGYARRLREPLRLAVAGMVKAGKSTVLNALIGEQIAPTDAGECTRTITWYRYGRTATITAHLHGGAEVRLPVTRSAGALVLDLGSRTAEDIAWIDVVWPSESLRSTVLIDTPGIASISQEVSERSTRFLTPTRSPSEADAILYLLRHIHGSDVRFLEAFRDTAAGASQTVNAVALLSRADEIGSGRIDSLLSAARIAERYRHDGDLRSLALECIPVAGLLAEGARTLRESEFAAFRTLARLDRAVRDRLLISVDRFTRTTRDTSLSVTQRRELLARFGIFGVRLGAALVRGGARTSSQLSERMVAQSGLIDVQRFVADQFRARGASLKARSVLVGLEMLLEDHPTRQSTRIRAGIERITANSHDLRELALLAELRTAEPALAAADATAAQRLLGGSGTSALRRLGLRDDAEAWAIHARVDGVLGHWRRLAESPLSDRATSEACRVVIRSIEGVASELAVGSGSDRTAAADVVLASRPA